MSNLNIIAEVIDAIETRTITVTGRDAWALCELVKAGARGCTPIDHPGPRWSGYVHKLRHKYGLHVDTIDERHGGQFAGRHARYILRSVVQIVATSKAVAA
jgi:hypothetical protein